MLYAIFTGYMLACTMKGNFYFGLRVPLLCSVHPMKQNGTLMSSFMFNVLVFCLGKFVVYSICLFSLPSLFYISSSCCCLHSILYLDFEFIHCRKCSQQHFQHHHGEHARYQVRLGVHLLCFGRNLSADVDCDADFGKQRKGFQSFLKGIAKEISDF